MKIYKILFVLSLFGFFPQHGFSQDAKLVKSLETFQTFLYQVDRFYVDTVQVDDLVEKGMIEVLSQLDPHSVYIPEDEVKRMNEPLQGNFEGIGVQFNILRDTILVVATISGGPSEKIGIQAGDRIVFIEEEEVAGISIQNSDVIKRLRGEKGTTVNVKIQRRGEKNLLDFAIIRDKIPIFSVDAGYMASPKTGYIKVNRFGATTLTEFKEQFSELETQGMQNLILDLQGNGGGYLNTAYELVDELLSSDKLVVYTQGKSFPREDLITRRKGSFEKGRLIVLIDESSASASEIVAGAIQDWDRGLIVGRRSFGKGLVQRGYNLPNGAQFRLTVSRYYTPSGRSIQKPYDQGEEAYRKEKYERFSSGELFSSDSINFPDSLKYETNNKRIVYGGGGITPDFFVPLDTSQTSDFFSLLVRKGVLNQFTLDYTNNGRKKLLKKFNSVATFAKKFNPDDILDELKEYTDNAGIKWDDAGYETSQLWIQTRVKAFIARNLWDTEAFYVIINDLNKSYQEALQLIEGKDYDEFKLAAKI